MVPESALAVLFIGFIGSGLIGFFVLRTTLALNMLAEPNDRSSHQQATPGVGGIAFCVPVLIYLITAAGAFTELWSLVAATTLLAAVGLLDDLRDLSARYRLAAQALAAGMVLLVLFQSLALLWLPILLLLVVWHVNLFNFMDGIDGLAALQALFFCVSVFWLAPGMAPWIGYLCCVLAGGLTAFLVYNWPPARMFMGDVGSTVLGLLLIVMAIALWRDGHLPWTATAILLAGFWFDASWTLAVRLLTGQPIAQAHRSHLYQRLADRAGHRRTSLYFSAFAVLWLLPLASLAAARPGWGLVALVVAVTPLAWLAWRTGAGRAVRSERSNGQLH